MSEVSGKRTLEALSGRTATSIDKQATNQPASLPENVAIVNYILSHLGHDQRPYLEISIFNVKFCGLLDSGASRSIIGLQGWQQIKNFHPELNTSDSPPCRVANGKTCTSLGSVTLPVVLLDKLKLINFLVVPDVPSTIILGMDFWCIMEIIPDLKRDVWNFSTQPEVNSVMVTQTELSTNEQRRLQSFLEDKWQDMNTSLGCTALVEHHISTDSPPIKQHYYPVSPMMQKHIDAELEKMLEDDIIEPSKSPWSSPILMVPKKDKTFRFCVDFRKLNKVTKKDAYPIPFVSAILDRLRGAKYLSSLDIKSAYWQIPMSESSREYTAFTIPGRGLYHFKRMPFGLTNAPATWQRLIDCVLGADLEPHVFVYLDDIIIISETFEQHLEILATIFERLTAAGLTLSREKCQFCRPELHYLGYVVDKHGLRVDADKVNCIINIPIPTCVSEIRRFLGMASWYRRFVKDFSTISAPLSDLLRKHKKWEWTDDCAKSFQTLKEKLISAPILSCPDFERPFVVQTDASGFGLGAVLTQEHEDGEKVVCFLSRSLTKQERNYTTTERECLAVVWAVEKLRPYLEGAHFTVITDHHSLVWLHNLKEPSGRLCRWAVKLQQHDFDLVHRKGKDHVVPDCLSRAVVVTDAINCEDIHLEPWYVEMRNKVTNKPRKFSKWRVEDGILYKYVRSAIPDLTNDEDQWKQVVPKQRQKELIRNIHENPTTGHPGVSKTYHRLCQKYYWPKMRADVAHFVRRCVVCIEHKAVQLPPAGLMGSRPRVDRPFQLLSLDLMGPLPPSSRGFKYILAVCDYFSKFVLTFALRTATANKIVTHLENDVFLLFGVPQYIICDNGKQFRSTAFQSICKKYDANIMYNALYHPQNNPTERVNRVIKTMLATYVSDKQRDWDLYLPSVSCAIRTLVHDVTGFTPYFMNFGREQILSGVDHRQILRDDGQIVYDRRAIPEKRPLGFAKLFENVRIKMQRAYERNKAQYNLRRRPVEYTVGQRVWRRNFVLSNAGEYFAKKLAKKYVGPFVIKRKISNTSYELGDHKGKERGIWHVKDLKNGPPDDD